MDASLLMSPSYNPPLLSSDLQDLISNLFDPENISWLRHTAIKKFLAWRERKANSAIAAGGAASGGDSMMIPTSGMGILSQVSRTGNHTQRRPSQSLVSRGGLTTSPFNLSSSALGTGLSDFTRARLQDHMLSEERLAQVHLAKWASDIQRGLRSERLAFERLAGAERAKWLLDHIGEEVRDGQIGLLDSSPSPTGHELPQWALSKKQNERSRRVKGELDMELPPWARSGKRESEGWRGGTEEWRDPLGLCSLGDGCLNVADTLVRVLGDA